MTYFSQRLRALYAATYLCIVAIFFSVGLYWFYAQPWFTESREPLLLFLVYVSLTVAYWIGKPHAGLIINFLVTTLKRTTIVTSLVMLLCYAVFLVLVARYALNKFPNSGDELAYLMQAKLFATGQLWSSPPPIPDALQQLRFLIVGEKWVSQYTPGWPLVLAVGSFLTLPYWVINPIIGCTTLWVFFRLARKYVCAQTAWIGALLLSTSSFYIINSSSYFAHSWAALCGLCFVYFLICMQHAENRILYAVVSGCALGLLALTRTQNALIFLFPLLIKLVIDRDLRTTVLVSFGLFPFLLTLLLYNYYVTGDPFLSVQSLQEPTPFTWPSNLTTVLTLERLVALCLWTAFPLILGFVVVFIKQVRKSTTLYFEWIFPLTMLVFLFYGGDGGNQYGPRYYYEAWPLAILTALRGIDEIIAKRDRGAFAPLVCSAIVVSLVYQLSYFPARLKREHDVIVERQDVYTRVKNDRIQNAVVFIRGQVGTIRPMVAADLTRNGFDPAKRDVIYAIDNRNTNTEIRATFSGRQYYLYEHGHLAQLP